MCALVDGSADAGCAGVTALPAIRSSVVMSKASFQIHILKLTRRPAEFELEDRLILGVWGDDMVAVSLSEY